MRNVLQTEGPDPSVAGGEAGTACWELPRDMRDLRVAGDGFERLMAEVSGHLQTRSGIQSAETVTWALDLLADHIGACRISLIETLRDRSVARIVHSRCSMRSRLRPHTSVRHIGWFCGELTEATAHVVTRLDNLPPAAKPDRSFLEADGVRSCIAVPLGPAAEPDFALLCETTRSDRRWAVDTLNRVRLAGRMVAEAVRRDRADQTIIELSGRLVDAQEGERRRIARELHDDVSQRMAHLCLDLARLKDAYRNGASDIGDVADDLARRTRVLSTDIGRICRDLYPSQMRQQTDVATAIGALCRDFADRHGLEIEFITRLRSCKGSEVSDACLYRIAQEALRNVVRHSGADAAVVELRRRDRWIEMVITDTGCGFNVAHVDRGDGLGLNSMRDRLKLIGGRLSIETSPNLGTRLEVRVPVGWRHASRRGECHGGV